MMSTKEQILAQAQKLGRSIGSAYDTVIKTNNTIATALAEHARLIALINETTVPGPVRPNDKQLRTWLAQVFEEQIRANGYAPPDAMVPGGSIDSKDMTEWVAVARSIFNFFDDLSNEEIYGKILLGPQKPNVADDVATFWPKKDPGTVIPPIDLPEDPPIGTELLTPDLIMSRMEGHPYEAGNWQPSEAPTGILEVMPTWGIAFIGGWKPGVDSANYPSTPPYKSQRTKIRGWFVVSHTQGVVNKAANSGVKILQARTLALTKDGQWLDNGGHWYDGEMVDNQGLVYDGMKPDFAGDNIVVGIGGEGKYRRRSWHPTLQDIVPGGQLRTKIANTLVVVQASLVPIDPSKPHDWSAGGELLYVGVDNYDPQQDGFSSIFIKLTDKPRWGAAWDGDKQTLIDNPPPLADFVIN